MSRLSLAAILVLLISACLPSQADETPPAATTSSPPEEVVALGDAKEWLYEVSGKRYRISLVRRDGCVFMLHRFDDGKRKEYEVVFLDDKRFAKKASSNGNWMELNADGDLVLYKNNGQNTETARMVAPTGKGLTNSDRPAVVDEGEAQLKGGEQRKQQRIALLEKELDKLKDERAEAVRKQKPKLMTELAKQWKSKQEELEQAKAKPVEEYVNEMQAEAAAAKKAARDKAIEAARPPLEITATGINPNVINIPKLTIEIRNTKDMAVEAFEIDVECFDKFGDPVTWPGKGNLYSGISQERIGAKQTTRASWDLHLHRNTTKAKVWITRIKMADGSVWSQSRSEASKAGNIAPAEKMQ